MRSHALCFFCGPAFVGRRLWVCDGIAASTRWAGTSTKLWPLLQERHSSDTKAPCASPSLAPAAASAAASSTKRGRLGITSLLSLGALGLNEPPISPPSEDPSSILGWPGRPLRAA